MTDLADLFLRLYDEIGLGPFSGRSEASAWLSEPAVRALTGEVLSRARLGTLTDPWLDGIVAERGDRARFAILVALDGAFENIDPFGRKGRQGYLVNYADRYNKQGYYNSDRGDGLLLPSRSHPGRPSGIPSKREFFHLVRVLPSALEIVRLLRISPAQELPLAPGERVVVAIAGFLDDVDEIEFHASNWHGISTYRAGASASPDLAKRADDLLVTLDRSGAHIAVLPELTSSAELLAHWQELLGGSPAPADSKLKWILIGSGPSSDIRGSRPPYNRAIVLDRNGHIVVAQDKLSPFTFDADQPHEWGLSPQLGDGPTTEDIASGDRVVVAESTLGRSAILVCEDLTRANIHHALEQIGISHVLVPVFSKPPSQHSWEAQHAKNLVNSTGAWVVVANSLVIGRLTGETGRLPVGVVVGPREPRISWRPEFKLLEADDPASVVTTEVVSGKSHKWR